MHRSHSKGHSRAQALDYRHVAHVLWRTAIIRVDSYVTQAPLDRKSLLNLIGKAHHVVLEIVLVDITFGEIVPTPEFKLLLSIQRGKRGRTLWCTIGMLSARGSFKEGPLSER